MSDEATLLPTELAIAIDEPALVTESSPVRAVADDDEEMPLPTEPRTIFLGGLFILALLAALYAAQEIALPIVLAIVLKLFLQPLVRGLERLHVPRGLAALVAVGLLIAALVGTVSGLTGPAANWASKLPEAIPKLQEQLYVVGQSLAAGQRMLHELESLVGDSGANAGP